MLEIIVPSYNNGLKKVVEKVFDLNIEEVYNRLEGQLVIENALTPQEIRKALNKAEDNARMAHQLFVAAKLEFEMYDLEILKVESEMRRLAIGALSSDKTLKLHLKQITESDVKARMALMFPAEYTRLTEGKIKARETVEHMKRFADLWQSRCSSLKSLNNNS